MIATVNFGSKKIKYNLVFNGRKTLGISVKPDLSVIVKAPYSASRKKIREKVLKKAPWILKHQGFFLSFHPLTPQKKFVGGETHLYLGRQYRVKIIRRNEDSVKLRRPFIVITTLKKDKVKSLLKEWYRANAEKKFNDLSFPLIKRFEKYGVIPVSVVQREMKNRWGSCTPKGKILLNTELIKAPAKCIEYVIIHELCHLVYRNHTGKFFELLKKEMHDWEKWKMRLERMMA